MLTKPSTCGLCPLYDKGKGFVPDETVPDPAYAIVAEAPGSTEIAQGKPLVGKAGFVLRSWIMKAVPQIQVAYEQKKVSLCNVLRCLPPEVRGRAYPKGEEKRLAEAHCRQYDSIPKSVHTVILLGEHSQRLFFGSELEAEDAVDRQLGHEAKGVMGRVGRVYERDGKRWVFAPHPAHILRQPAFVSHGQEALRIAVGTDRVVEVDYVPWHQALEAL